MYVYLLQVKACFDFIELILYRAEVNSPSSNDRFVYSVTTGGGEKKNREMISLIVALMFKILCQFSWSEY